MEMDGEGVQSDTLDKKVQPVSFLSVENLEI